MQCCVRCTHTAVECMPSSCRFLSRSDSVTVSVWNNRKVQRREGAGFLGCVRLSPVNITRLRDTGCELFLCTATAENRRETDCVCVELCWYSSVTATPPPPLLPPPPPPSSSPFLLPLPASSDQRLNLTKCNPEDEEMVRGQLIRKFLTPT